MINKWSTSYWSDLGERAGRVLVYGLITMLTADSTGAVSGSPKQWWLVVVLPAALSVLTSLGANLADSVSGASLLPSPPGPGPVIPEAVPTVPVVPPVVPPEATD
jgi:hypothetical protein